MVKPDDPILRYPELCTYLGGISFRTVQRWIRDRGFPRPIKLSPRLNGWRLSHVEAWLNSRERAA